MPEIDTQTVSYAFTSAPAGSQVRFDVSSEHAPGRTLTFARSRPGAGTASGIAAAVLALGLAGVVLGDPQTELRAVSYELGDMGSEARGADRNAVLSAQIIKHRYLTAQAPDDGDRAPTSAAIEDALAFLDLLPFGPIMPKVMVAGDGEVGFYWKTANGYIDVGFYGDGTIRYYAVARGEPIEARGPAPYSRKSLPKDLLAVIERI